MYSNRSNGLGVRHSTAMAVIAIITVLLPVTVEAQALPSGWGASNVGSPRLAGSATFANGVFKVSGAGSGVDGRADELMFVYRTLTGDGVIVARVDGFEGAASRARAGAMIRESLSPGSKQAFVNVSRGGTVRLQLRTATNGRAYTSSEGDGEAPIWLRLERRESTLLASRSADGISWTPAGSASMTMGATVYVGLAVTSRTSWSRATAAFSNVNNSGGAPTSTNQPPAISLSSPSAGTTFVAPASVSIAANASDPQGAIAHVRFYAGATLLGSDTTAPYAYMWSGATAGSYALTAVARDAGGLETTSAPVTVNVSASAPANRPPTVSLTTPAGGATFGAPAAIAMGASATDPDGTVARVDFYSGSTLLGSDSTSPYAFTWNNVATGSYAVTAVARDNLGATATSAPSSISVTSNQAPTVSLTAPANGATLTAPASITISATASDVGGSILSVDFYAGSVLLFSDTTSPYSFAWTNVAAGQYSVTAVARDNAGAMTTSGARNVTVSNTPLLSSAVWVPSANHSTAVDSYVVEIFPNGADTTTADPVAAQDVGKPAVVSGECRADVGQTIAGLVPGTYVATVTAVGASGESRSAPSAPFSR